MRKKNTMNEDNPNRDLNELTVEELVYLVQLVISDSLAAGYTSDDLLQHEPYRDLEQYVDDRLRALRDRDTGSATIYAAMFPRASHEKRHPESR